MARNQIQFQKGLSDVEFQRLYGTEAQCVGVLLSTEQFRGYLPRSCPVVEGDQSQSSRSSNLITC